MPQTNTPSPLVTALVRRREALALTQRDIAEKLGVSHAAVNAWESGFRGLNLDRATAYGAAVGMELGWNPPAPLPPEREVEAAFATLGRHLGKTVEVADA